MSGFIPQIEPWIDNSELVQLKRVIDSTYVVENKLTEEFEALIRDMTGSKYAIAMANGTVALYASLLACGIGRGDEVIVPDLTFVATANACIMAGAKPVFCDVEWDTLGIDPKKLESCLSKKTKAIMPVHLYGQSAKMEEIMSFARANNLMVIEDAAQGVGVKYKGTHVGTFGDCGMLSFYGNKTITCGEGGIVLTDSEEIYSKCWKLKNHGRPVKGTFIHEDIGYNFAFTDIQAAIGISQMAKLPKIINKKNQIRNKYIQALEDIEEINFLKIHKDSTPVHWFTSLYTDKKEQLSQHLKDNNIGARNFFYPLHKQPCYMKNKKMVKMFGKKKYPVSTTSYETGMSLPSSFLLTEEDQDKVIREVRNFYGC